MCNVIKLGNKARVGKKNEGLSRARKSSVKSPLVQSVKSIRSGTVKALENMT